MQVRKAGKQEKQYKRQYEEQMATAGEAHEYWKVPKPMPLFRRKREILAAAREVKPAVKKHGISEREKVQVVGK